MWYPTTRMNLLRCELETRLSIVAKLTQQSQSESYARPSDMVKIEIYIKHRVRSDNVKGATSAECLEDLCKLEGTYPILHATGVVLQPYCRYRFAQDLQTRPSRCYRASSLDRVQYWFHSHRGTTADNSGPANGRSSCCSGGRQNTKECRDHAKACWWWDGRKAEVDGGRDRVGSLATSIDEGRKIQYANEGNLGGMSGHAPTIHRNTK